MAIGTTAALLGSAVIGAGATAYGASKASKAAGKAADANAQIQSQQYQQTRADLSPFMQGGYAANAELMQRLGLAAPGGAATSAANGNSGATYLPGSSTPANNFSAYIQNNPDLLNLFQSQKGMAKGKTMEEFGQYHWQNFGQGEGRSFTPATQAQQTQAATPPPQTGTQAPETTAPPADAPSGTTFPIDNNGGLGPRLEYTRPEFTEQQPEIGTGPMSADYLQNFETSPGYQFRFDQGLQGVNNNFAARGLLKSGGALKGINDYAQGMASQEYGNWFAQQMQRLGADQGQFNTDRATSLAQYNQNRNVFNTNANYDQARLDNIFESDRAYNTGRYDTQTGNLFQLAGMGQSAAAGVGAAGQNYAAGMTANNNNLASVRGNAAIAGANGISGAINSAAGAYGMYSNPFSVTGGSSGGWLPNGLNGAF